MIWAEIMEGKKHLEGFCKDWAWEKPEGIWEDCLAGAYRAAINVAAGLEKLVIRREKGNGGVGDAQ